MDFYPRYWGFPSDTFPKLHLPCCLDSLSEGPKNAYCDLVWPLQFGSAKLTSKWWKWKCSTWSSFRNLQKSTKMLEDFTILMALKDMMDHSDVKLRYGFVKSQALCSSIPPYFNSHKIQIGDLVLLHPKKKSLKSPCLIMKSPTQTWHRNYHPIADDVSTDTKKKQQLHKNHLKQWWKNGIQ